ncbi:hypothetical protein [Absidia glauca]|uniref:Uncharacterized protein n=1 Tax=Absidia glauca TaxID=4829 RepID=A0A168QN18_ABSGL|nr:hypothetical protein [Absidia glauca]
MWLQNGKLSYIMGLMSIIPSKSSTTTSDNSYSATLDMYRAEPTKALFSSKPSDKDRYEEDDDDATTTTSTGATLSTMMDQDHTPEPQSAAALHLVDSPPPSRSSQMAAFEISMRDTLPSRNTYFLDGGNRFISVYKLSHLRFTRVFFQLPTLGNANTKTVAHLSRLFEEWLQDKLGHQQQQDRLPILEDSVDLLAEDILNKLKSRTSIRGLGSGVAKIMIKIRTGHVYCFNQDTIPPLLTPDMMDFIQQFPLFLDTNIHVEPKSSMDDPDHEHSIPVLLSIENVSTNPSDPYFLFENVSLLV